MNFGLTEEQRLLKRTVHNFAQDKIEPLAAEIDINDHIPLELIDEMSKLGLFGLTIPEIYGGSGQGQFEFCIVTEELSRASAAVGGVLRVSLSLAMVPIIQFGSNEQKQRYLRPHAEGRLLACFALTESGAGSDVAALSTSARKKEKGYLLNGAKLFISLGEEADISIVFATVDKSLRHKGIAAFIVEKGTPGFSVGKRERKLGLHGMSAVELVFEDCYVPESNRLGNEGDGFKIALSALNSSRTTVGAEAVGIALAAYEAALNYARDRKQFGRKLGEFQAIQFMLADMTTQIDAARLMTYQAAVREDLGLDFIKEAAQAKLFSSEMSRMVTNAALQIFGGYGYTKDYPLERHLRDARITEIYEGTSEMMRLIIAKCLFG